MTVTSFAHALFATCNVLLCIEKLLQCYTIGLPHFKSHFLSAMRVTLVVACGAHPAYNVVIPHVVRMLIYTTS